jgi:hypothetical protein
MIALLLLEIVDEEKCRWYVYFNFDVKCVTPRGRPSSANIRRAYNKKYKHLKLIPSIQENNIKVHRKRSTGLDFNSSRLSLNTILFAHPKSMLRHGLLQETEQEQEMLNTITDDHTSSIKCTTEERRSPSPCEVATDARAFLGYIGIRDECIESQLLRRFRDLEEENEITYHNVVFEVLSNRCHGVGDEATWENVGFKSNVAQSYASIMYHYVDPSDLLYEVVWEVPFVKTQLSQDDITHALSGWHRSQFSVGKKLFNVPLRSLEWHRDLSFPVDLESGVASSSSSNAATQRWYHTCLHAALQTRLDNPMQTGNRVTDFCIGPAFYMNRRWEDAVKWADKVSRRSPGHPAVVIWVLDIDVNVFKEMGKDTEGHRTFPQHEEEEEEEEWAQLVRHCRTGGQYDDYSQFDVFNWVIGPVCSNPRERKPRMLPGAYQFALCKPKSCNCLRSYLHQWLSAVIYFPMSPPASSSSASVIEHP